MRSSSANCCTFQQFPRTKISVDGSSILWTLSLCWSILFNVECACDAIPRGQIIVKFNAVEWLEAWIINYFTDRAQLINCRLIIGLLALPPTRTMLRLTWLSYFPILIILKMNLSQYFTVIVDSWSQK